MWPVVSKRLDSTDLSGLCVMRSYSSNLLAVFFNYNHINQ